MAEKAFVYDPPRPGLTRLFKLDLNELDAPLSGQILSFINLGVAFQQFDVRASWNALREHHWRMLKELLHDGGYCAISYTWGPPGDEARLALRPTVGRISQGRFGCEDESSRAGIIPIRKSLCAMLQEFRRQKIDRFLWVDAVCIDQGSDEDKSSQIPSMRFLYANANVVYAWLGACPDTRNPLDRLADLASALWNHESGEHIQDELNVLDPCHLGLPPSEASVWSDLHTLFTLPWWTRLWTLQEAAMALGGRGNRPDGLALLYGSKKLPWRTLSRFTYIARRYQLGDFIVAGVLGGFTEDKQGFDAIEEIDRCVDSLFNQGYGVRLDDVLLATRRRRSTMAADMVLGQCAMLDRKTLRNLRIEPTQPAETVFVNFGKYYLRQEPTECLLNHVCTEERNADLPSWCPNFASPPETAPLGSEVAEGNLKSKSSSIAGEGYHAGFDRDSPRYRIPRRRLRIARAVINVYTLRTPHYKYFDTDDPRQVQLVKGSDAIRLRGFDLDAVAEIIDCNPRAESSNFLDADRLEQTRAWDAACWALARRTLGARAEAGESDARAVYARTIVAGRTRPAPTETARAFFDRHGTEDFVAPYRGFRRFVDARSAAWEPPAPEGRHAPEGGLAPGDQPAPEATLDRASRRFASVVRQVTRRRRFFATCGGRIGLGPSRAAPGDRLCVVWFCPTPYLLRPTGDGDGRFRLVGECYVHGLMYGEVLGMFERGEVCEKSWVVE